MDPGVLESVADCGWVVQPGGLAEVRRAASDLGWIEVPLRRGEPSLARLRPLAKESARPSSMSAVVGRGAQPLHTDGAHMIHPPDVIAMSAVRPSTTATLVWSCVGTGPFGQALRQGVFRADSGGRSFLCSAMDDERVRFDPCCMTPCDGLARKVLAFMDEFVSHATRHSWETWPQTLIVDNRHVLHARDVVELSDRDRVLERVAFSMAASA